MGLPIRSPLRRSCRQTLGQTASPARAPAAVYRLEISPGGRDIGSTARNRSLRRLSACSGCPTTVSTALPPTRSRRRADGDAQRLAAHPGSARRRTSPRAHARRAARGTSRGAVPRAASRIAPASPPARANSPNPKSLTPVPPRRLSPGRHGVARRLLPIFPQEISLRSSVVHVASGTASMRPSKISLCQSSSPPAAL